MEWIENNTGEGERKKKKFRVSRLRISESLAHDSSECRGQKDKRKEIEWT